MCRIATDCKIYPCIITFHRNASNVGTCLPPPPKGSDFETSGYYGQEHIEPAREHVTHIDGEFQTWLPGTNFSNIQIWKGSNVRVHTCVRRDPRHSPRVNRGFNPIQQQPLYCSRQQRATHPRVPFFWIKNTWTYSVEGWGRSVSICSFCSTLTRSNTPLLTPCSTSLAKLASCI